MSSMGHRQAAFALLLDLEHLPTLHSSALLCFASPVLGDGGALAVNALLFQPPQELQRVAFLSSDRFTLC
jgi:hypothetical protein